MAVSDHNKQSAASLLNIIEKISSEEERTNYLLELVDDRLADFLSTNAPSEKDFLNLLVEIMRLTPIHQRDIITSRFVMAQKMNIRSAYERSAGIAATSQSALFNSPNPQEDIGGDDLGETPTPSSN